LGYFIWRDAQVLITTAAFHLELFDKLWIGLTMIVRRSAVNDRSLAGNRDARRLRQGREECRVPLAFQAISNIGRKSYSVAL
jgi:hypothetical protein